MPEETNLLKEEITLKRHSKLVFLTAFCCLMLELILSRVASFHLGQSYGYLAIPITFLGLAIGGLHVHLSKGRITERFNIARHVMVLMLLTLFSLIMLFVAFRFLFPVIYEVHTRAANTTQLWRTIVFIAVNLGPFYMIGRILSSIYFINRKSISSIYSADLWGAAVACFLTPIMFHYFDLPNVLLVCVIGLAVLFLAFQKTTLRIRIATGIALGIGLLGMNLLVIYVEDNLDFSKFKSNRKHQYTQVHHNWNEFSRVALLRETGPKWGTTYSIVHDNGLSNVAVDHYRPQKVHRPKNFNTFSIFNVSFLLKRQTDDVLVMFAGAGSEMILFNELAGGKANVTGVEINQLVKDLALNSPELKDYRLKEFYELPQINLVIKEGRHYLDEDKGKYDVIFMGRDAATGLHLTAHSRKYLDSEEAYEEYLKHLKPDGVLTFYHKSLGRRLLTLKKAHFDLGGKDFDKKIIVLDSLRSGRGHDMIFSQSGFSDNDVRLIENATKTGEYRVVYAPGRAHNSRFWKNLVVSAIDDNDKIMTDDLPFLRGLDLDKYSLLPGDNVNFLGWAKISTLLFIALLSIVILALVSVPRQTRPPSSVLVYLTITGFCYMLSEIALMAKLELFLKDPLVSMATVLTAFLIAGGLGSRLVSHVAKWLDMRWVPFGVALVVFGCIFLFDFMNNHLIGLPFAIKTPLAAIAVMPVGICLGLFYPYLITCLVGNDMDKVVPLTYGVSTLASVVGATYAMTAMLEYGFSNLLLQATVGYAVLGVFVILYLTVSRKKLLRIPR